MKNVLFIVIATLILLIGVEGAIGYAYFQKNGRYPWAIVEMSHWLSFKTAQRRAENYIQELKAELGGADLEWSALSGALASHLYTAEGEELLESFAQRYEADFVKMKEAVEAAGSKFVVVYIPSRKGKDSREWCELFFRQLAARHQVDFVNLSRDMDKAGDELVTLYPWNGHLSRYGNYIVAEGLEGALKKYEGYRSPVSIEAPHADFADNPPNMRKNIEILPGHPYFVKTNQYGFRTEEDFDLGDPRQRIVVLGDSMTYGPYVANEDTYTGILQRKLGDDVLVLNAGKPGFTIVHQAEMFIEKTQYAAPDITILQVLDNDIYGMFYFKLNEFDRHHRIHEPTEVELKHIRQVIGKLKEGHDA